MPPGAGPACIAWPTSRYSRCASGYCAVDQPCARQAGNASHDQHVYQVFGGRVAGGPWCGSGTADRDELPYSIGRGENALGKVALGTSAGTGILVYRPWYGGGVSGWEREF